MVGININEKGALAFERKLGDVEARGADMRPLFDIAVHPVLLKIEQMQFRYRGRNTKWPTDDPSTLRKKRAAGQRLAVMRATEALVDSLVNPADANHVWEADRNSFVFGSDLESFMVQQDNESGRHMPFRPPIDLTANDVRKIERLVARYVADGVLR